MLKSKNVLVRSDGKESKNNFTVFLQNPIRNVRKISVVSCAIVNSSYNVVEGVSDKLYVYLGGTAETSASSVTVTPGNYSVSQLTSSIQNLLNSSITLGVSTWVVSYNPITYKVTISSTVNFHMSSMRGAKLLYNIGFSGAQTTAKKTFTSDAVVRLSSPRNVLLTFGNIPLSTMDIPETYQSTHFVLPMYAQSGSVTFLNSMDLAGQSVDFSQDAVDIDRLEIKLYEPDKNRTLYSLFSDWSIIFNISYSE